MALDKNQQLVNDVVASDGPSFGQLLMSCDDRMRALAFRMLGSQTEMDDALQDAYLKAFRSRSTFRGASAFCTWLYRIVSTTCIDHLRKKSRKHEVSFLEELDIEGTHIFEDQVVTNVEVLHALNELPSDQRAALVLVDIEGYSYGAAASALEIEKGTVASRVSRARNNFRQAIVVHSGERS